MFCFEDSNTCLAFSLTWREFCHMAGAQLLVAEFEGSFMVFLFFCLRVKPWCFIFHALELKNSWYQNKFFLGHSGGKNNIYIYEENPLFRYDSDNSCFCWLSFMGFSIKRNIRIKQLSLRMDQTEYPEPNQTKTQVFSSINHQLTQVFQFSTRVVNLKLSIDWFFQFSWDSPKKIVAEHCRDAEKLCLQPTEMIKLGRHRNCLARWLAGSLGICTWLTSWLKMARSFEAWILFANLLNSFEFNVLYTALH